MAKIDKKAVEKVVSNKTVHIELPNVLHKKLRVLLFLNNMSMQKFFTLMAESYINSDSYIEKLVIDRVKEIKEDKLNKLRNIDQKDIYDAIEENSPFK